MSASPTPSFASNAAKSRAQSGGVRRFFREVWQSYLRHSELRVMLASGRWTPQAELAVQKRNDH
jgi:hypothetical protein